MKEDTKQQLKAIGIIVFGAIVVIYSIIRLILIYQGVD